MSVTLLSTDSCAMPPKMSTVVQVCGLHPVVCLLANSMAAGLRWIIPLSGYFVSSDWLERASHYSYNDVYNCTPRKE